jgi:pimeloyl-ACP methyl ester carboxylesterase
MGNLPVDGERVPLDVKVDEEVTLDGGIVRKKLTYQSRADHRVAAYLFLPKGEAERPAMLCLHPTGAPGKKIAAGIDGKANRAYAIELAQRGYVTIAPDYPTFGDYKIENPSAEPWHSGTMRAIRDNSRAVDLLQTLPQVDGERIGAIGHSLGGHNAMFTAVFEPRIKAVVSSCGWTRFHKYKGGNLAGWTSSRYMPTIASEYHNSPDEVPFDFTEIVAAIAPRGFFTSSPLHDDNFDIGGVKEGLEAARPIYRLLGAESKLMAIHPDCPHDFPDEARAAAYAFLDEQLGGKK